MKYRVIPSQDIGDMSLFKLKKSTFVISVLCTLPFLLAYIPWIATRLPGSQGVSSNQEITISDTIIIWTIIFVLISALTVSWEEGDYIWFVFFGLGYLNIYSGSLTLSFFVDVIVLPLYLILRFSSWRSFLKKIKGEPPENHP
jgi:hypothetical protein